MIGVITSGLRAQVHLKAAGTSVNMSGPQASGHNFIAGLQALVQLWAPGPVVGPKGPELDFGGCPKPIQSLICSLYTLFTFGLRRLPDLFGRPRWPGCLAGLAGVSPGWRFAWLAWLPGRLAGWLGAWLAWLPGWPGCLAGLAAWLE